MDPAFSPDGQWVAFARTVHPGARKTELYVAAAGGGEPRRIPNVNGTILGLCWAADGREIIYSMGHVGWAEEDLWRVPVAGGLPRRIGETGEYGRFPSIARSGRRMAFTRQFVDTNIWQLELTGAGGSVPRAVKWISSTRSEAAPAFSPDGNRIAFNSNRSGITQVWTCNRDGSNPSQLTNVPEPGASLGAWSPDGAYLAYDSPLRGHTDVYIIPSQGATACSRRTAPRTTPRVGRRTAVGSISPVTARAGSRYGRRPPWEALPCS